MATWFGGSRKSLRRASEQATRAHESGLRASCTDRPTFLDEALAQMWKEIREGRVLLVLDDGGPGMERVVSSPLSWMAKQNMDRTMSDEDRFCHDLRFPVNEGTPADTLPAVVLNTHREVARQALRLASQYPGIPRRLAKRDVKSAFKLFWVHPGDSENMATDLPGSAAGFADSLVAVYLVFTFGWKGSPAAWQCWADCGSRSAWHTSSCC